MWHIKSIINDKHRAPHAHHNESSRQRREEDISHMAHNTIMISKRKKPPNTFEFMLQHKNTQNPHRRARTRANQKSPDPELSSRSLMNFNRLCDSYLNILFLYSHTLGVFFLYHLEVSTLLMIENVQHCSRLSMETFCQCETECLAGRNMKSQ